MNSIPPLIRRPTLLGIRDVLARLVGQLDTLLKNTEEAELPVEWKDILTPAELKQVATTGYDKFIASQFIANFCWAANQDDPGDWVGDYLLEVKDGSDYRLKDLDANLGIIIHALYKKGYFTHEEHEALSQYLEELEQGGE